MDGVTTDSVAVTITDDAPETVEVSFDQGSYTVAEGSTVTVKVKLDADPERTVTIPLTKANQDGASNSDYSGVPANVVFNANGHREVLYLHRHGGYDDNDDGESVKLGFDTLPDDVTEGLHQGSGRIHHRRRRAFCDRQLRAGVLHGGRGRHRHGEGEAGRRSRTHGHHTPDQSQSGRGVELRLLRCAPPTSCSTAPTPRSPLPSPPRRMMTTTTARASSWASTPCPPA